MLKVKCPNNGSECSIVGGEIMESMVLLGDGEQNMQCLACGYASNSNMKTHIQPFPKILKMCVLKQTKADIGHHQYSPQKTIMSFL